MLFSESVDDFKLLAEVVAQLQPVIYGPESLLIKQRTLGTEMFFLSQGSVKVL